MTLFSPLYEYSEEPNGQWPMVEISGCGTDAEDAKVKTVTQLSVLSEGRPASLSVSSGLL